MDDVAQRSEGKQEIQVTQGDWEATARMYYATLVRERAEHQVVQRELKRARRALERAGFTYTEGAAEWRPPVSNSASPLISHISELTQHKSAGLTPAAVLADTVGEMTPQREMTVMRRVYLERISELTQQKDGAYQERNRVLALLGRMAVALGWKAGIGEHPASDVEWEKDWRTILFIELPTGQASWHFHDSDVHLLQGLPPYGGTWDGHTTEEKYGRVANALRGVVTPPLGQCRECGQEGAPNGGESKEEAIAKTRARAERFIPPLCLPQHEEVLKSFSASTHGSAAREAYMRSHGLVYVEGVLHWEKDQLPATCPVCEQL